MANKTIYPFGVGGQTASGIDIANDLETSSAVIALSARQGRVLKQAVETVQSNVQNLHGALANMAFTELPKPTLTTIDWTGGTFYVTISKSLTGCTGSNNATQIAEGSSYTNTITLNTNHSLQSISVLMSGIDITSTAYDSSTGIISIASVTGNIAITVVAVEVVTYKVNNHFINVNSSNSASQVEQGDAYNTILSPITGATSNNDLRVFISGDMMTLGTDYTFDSTTGALSIPAAKITGDIDVCATAYTGKITITVKAGTSTTVKMARDQWAANFYDDTIDASESAEDVTVVIDNVPTYNSKPTVSIITIGTKSAIKAIDFGGCSTRDGGNKFTMYGYTDLESFSGLAYIETPNNAAVTISNFFRSCSSLSGKLDVMTWRCDTMTKTEKIVDNCTADEIIMPYMPNLTQLYLTLGGCKVKRVIFNKTGVITQFRQIFSGATGLEYLDISKCPVHIGTGTYDWYMTEDNTTNTFTLKIGVFEMDFTPNNGLTHVGKLICTTTTPPGAAILGALSANVQIYVPNSVVEAYKSAWSAMANNIHSINDYTEE